MSSAALITAKDLELSYGNKVVVQRSDFEIAAGTVTAIIGPNGAGKSTLLNAIAGLVTPSAGTLTVDTGSRVNVAYVLQTTKVNELTPITVREVVGMGRYATLGMFKPFTAHDHRIRDRAMERLAITDLSLRHLSELSGGQRQRVFVAQGLAQEASLLLLDEPITGLDLVSRDYIIQVIEEERAQGHTVVGTTHDLSEAAMADTVILLANRVVAYGPPDQVLTTKALSVAYGLPLTTTADGRVFLDDAHHRGLGGRHVHFRREV